MPRLNHRSLRGLVALAWLLTSGCAGWSPLLPVFWGHGGTLPPPQAGPPPQPAPAAAPPGHAGPGHPPTGAPHPLAPAETTPQHVAELTQRIAVSEDERKALAARVQLLETALAEKDQALGQAGKEIQGTREEVARARAELQRSKQEISDIHNRLRSTEKDNLATLQSIVSMLERMVERDKPAEGQRESAPAENPPGTK